MGMAEVETTLIPLPGSHAMMELVRKLGQRVIGVLCGFDRLLFRGILRCVINPRGRNGYLYGAGVPMTKFGEHAEQVSELVKEESCRHAQDTGREVRYLESSQDRKKDIALEIARRDNGICHVDDLEAAQRLLNKQLRVSWTSLLNHWARQVHPAHETIFAKCPEHARNYYWSVAESEWASDVLSRDPAEVLPVCQRLAGYSLRVHGPADVMRFLGRTVRSDGLPRTNEIRSQSRRFRALNPLSHDDIQLLTAVAQPQYVVSGLRNRDLRSELYGADPSDGAQKRRRSSATSRKLSWLRTHGLLEKIAKSHRYRVTAKGRHALTALLAAANATTGELRKLVA